MLQFRVVQEALTNAAKKGTTPMSGWRWAAPMGYSTSLSQTTVGPGPRAGTGTGHGLLGLRERVEVFDGTMDAAPRPGGGFRVRVALPIGSMP